MSAAHAVSIEARGYCPVRRSLGSNFDKAQLDRDQHLTILGVPDRYVTRSRTLDKVRGTVGESPMEEDSRRFGSEGDLFGKEDAYGRLTHPGRPVWNRDMAVQACERGRTAARITVD